MGVGSHPAAATLFSPAPRNPPHAGGNHATPSIPHPRPGPPPGHHYPPPPPHPRPGHRRRRNPRMGRHPRPGRDPRDRLRDRRGHLDVRRHLARWPVDRLRPPRARLPRPRGRRPGRVPYPGERRRGQLSPEVLAGRAEHRLHLRPEGPDQSLDHGRGRVEPAPGAVQPGDPRDHARVDCGRRVHPGRAGRRHLDVPRRRGHGDRGGVVRGGIGFVAFHFGRRALRLLPRPHAGFDRAVGGGPGGRRSGARRAAGDDEPAPHGPGDGGRDPGDERDSIAAVPALGWWGTGGRDFARWPLRRLRPPASRRDDRVEGTRVRPQHGALDPRPGDRGGADRHGPHHAGHVRGDEGHPVVARVRVGARRRLDRDLAGWQAAAPRRGQRRSRDHPFHGAGAPHHLGAGLPGIPDRRWAGPGDVHALADGVS